MKYYKSKRGYFYKIIGDKKIRISIEEYKMKCKKGAIKGGTIQKNGKLEISDFQVNVSGQPEKFTRLHQLQKSQSINNDILNLIHLKVIRKPWYLGNEPVIFFGGESYYYFSYACHNDSIFSKKINFFRLNGNSVVPTSINDISTKNLIELFYGLKNIRIKNRSFMTKLYNTLEFEFMKINRLNDISKLRFANRNKIKELTKYSGPNFINSSEIKQSLRTLESFTTNPEEVLDILNKLQYIEKEKDRLLKKKGKITAMTYQQNEFRKLIDSILQKKGIESHMSRS